jgi:hypothetical protein
MHLYVHEHIWYALRYWRNQRIYISIKVLYFCWWIFNTTLKAVQTIEICIYYLRLHVQMTLTWISLCVLTSGSYFILFYFISRQITCACKFRLKIRQKKCIKRSQMLVVFIIAIYIHWQVFRIWRLLNVQGMQLLRVFSLMYTGNGLEGRVV